MEKQTTAQTKHRTCPQKNARQKMQTHFANSQELCETHCSSTVQYDNMNFSSVILRVSNINCRIPKHVTIQNVPVKMFYYIVMYEVKYS